MSPPKSGRDFASDALAALVRAAQRAQERAAATHTAVAVWRNGRVETLKPAVGQSK